MVELCMVICKVKVGAKRRLTIADIACCAPLQACAQTLSPYY